MKNFHLYSIYQMENEEPFKNSQEWGVVKQVFVNTTNFSSVSFNHQFSKSASHKTPARLFSKIEKFGGAGGVLDSTYQYTVYRPLTPLCGMLHKNKIVNSFNNN